MTERTLVIIIDALGWEIAAHHGFYPASIPFRTRLRSVLGFSQAALTSMITGAMPDVHGLWMMYSFDGRKSPFRMIGYLGMLGSTERLWVRNLLRWKVSKFDGVTSYYSLYDIPGTVLRQMDLPARRATFGPGGGGSRRTIIDEAFEREAPFVRDYDTPEDIAMGELLSALRGGKSRFHLVYTAKLDSRLHEVGTRGPEIGEILKRYGEFVDAVAGEFPDLKIVVLGDHGMCDVSRHIDVISAVEEKGLSIPGDYVPFYDSTMARFRIFGARAADIIGGVLGETEGGRLLGNEELAGLGTGFSDGRYGDLVYLCDPGTIILPSFMGNTPVKGMHGYHPDARCMDSVMLSNAEFGGEERSIAGVAGFLMPGFRGGDSEG